LHEARIGVPFPRQLMGQLFLGDCDQLLGSRKLLAEARFWRCRWLGTATGNSDEKPDE
jgi:hypothetical protein